MIARYVSFSSPRYVRCRWPSCRLGIWSLRHSALRRAAQQKETLRYNTRRRTTTPTPHRITSQNKDYYLQYFGFPSRLSPTFYSSELSSSSSLHTTQRDRFVSPHRFHPNQFQRRAPPRRNFASQHSIRESFRVLSHLASSGLESSRVAGLQLATPPSPQSVPAPRRAGFSASQHINLESFLVLSHLASSGLESSPVAAIRRRSARARPPTTRHYFDDERRGQSTAPSRHTERRDEVHGSSDRSKA